MISIDIGLSPFLLDTDDIDVPPPPISIEVVGGSLLEISVGEGTLEVSISGSEYHDGIYVIDPADLANGPVNLSPPILIGVDPVGGDTLTIEPGLWIFSQDHDAPVVTMSTNGAGQIVGETYVSDVTDGGTSVSIIETATQGVGERSVTSDPVALGGGAVFGPLDLGTKLVGWWDATDTAMAWQDIGATTPATTQGDTVLRLDDKSASATPLVIGTTFGPGHGLLASDGVDWNGGKFIVAALGQRETGMEIHAVIENDDPAPFIMANSELASSRFFGVAQSGGGGAAQNGYAAPVYATNGVDENFAIRDDVYVGWGVGRKVVSVRNLDWSGTRGENLILMGYRNNGTFRFFGTVRHIIVTSALTTTERTDLTDWLMGEAI